MTHAELQVAAAQAGQSPGGGSGLMGFLLPIAAFGLIFYAFIIRPQQRQQKEHRDMVSAIQRGDQVVSSGGIHGRVTGVADDVLTVEIADRVRIRLNRSAVSSRTPKSTEEKKS